MKASHLQRTPGSTPPSPPAKSPEGVRSEKVARARQLLADAGYPPPTVLRKVAEKLAANLKALRKHSRTWQN